MATTITRLFDSYDDARNAVRDLEANGIAHDRISIVANNADNRYDTADTVAGPEADRVADDASTGAGTGATLGTIVGGGAGLLAGLGMLAIPGVGPIVAAGWLIATVTGAGAGAAAGGLLGSLTGAGVSEADAHVYAEGVRRGGTLLSVRAEESEVVRVEQVLASYATADVSTRGEEFRSGGWSRFDETGPAYTAATAAEMGTPGLPGTGTMGTGTMGTGAMGAGTLGTADVVPPPGTRR